MRIRMGLCLIGSMALTTMFAAPAGAQTAEVSAIDNAYEPRNLEVTAGTSVTWTNDGDAPHTVTADNGSFDSGNMDPGDEFSETFVEPGRYPYYCEYHGSAGGQGMAGVVVVSAQDDGNGQGDPTDEPTDEPTEDDDTAGTTDTDDSDLPATGTEVDAFIFLALALILSGAVLMKLGSPTPTRR